MSPIYILDHTAVYSSAGSKNIIFQMNSLLELDISKFPKKPVVVNGKLQGTDISWKDLVARAPQYFSNLLRTVRNPAQFSSTVHTRFTTIRRQLLMDPPNRSVPLILTES